ncbi:MAG: PQQ-binding-like beta-propeller repeat protein, partial [Acetobacteraceae bacterium]
GKIVWTMRQRAAIASSMLASAGGVVFSGSHDREFHAYDAATGKLLWQAGLNSAPSSSPVTYSAGGVQYVAVVAGGGGALDAGVGALAPEVTDPGGSTTLWVFKLRNAAPAQP